MERNETLPLTREKNQSVFCTFGRKEKEKGWFYGMKHHGQLYKAGHGSTY